MARPARAVVDETPLTSRHVDVRARVGWTLRMSRLVAHTSGSQMSARLAGLGLRVSQPMISGVENGTVAPSTHLVRGYEQVLAAAPGSLRGMVTMLGRTFGPALPPADRRPDLATLSEAYDRVTAPSAGVPDAGDWLDLAELMTAPGCVSPAAVVRPLVRRLQSELARSVGPAYLGRYEALTRFRGSVYAEQVEEAVAEAVNAPGAMAVVDRIVVLAEHYTPSTFELLAGWLSHSDAAVVRGAAMALVNFRTPSSSGPVDWSELVTPFVEAYNASSGDPSRYGALCSLYRNLPRPVRESVAPHLDRPVPALDRPTDWTTSRRNRQLNDCIGLARTITDALDVPEQPMLARLLFEAIFDFRPDRQFTSAMTLGLLPCHELIGDSLVGLAETTADLGTQRGVLNVAMSLSAPASERVARAWLGSDDEPRQADALVAAAHAGVRVPSARLAELVTRGGIVRERAVYAAGMTGHPILRTWASDRTADDWLRVGARWWRAEGSRVAV